MRSGDGGLTGGRDRATWHGRGYTPRSFREDDASPRLAVFDDERAPKSWWLLRFAALLLVAGGTAFLVLGPEAGDRALELVPGARVAVPGATDSATSSGAGADASEPGGTAAGEPNPGATMDEEPDPEAAGAGALFVRRADALVAALDRYDERRRQFDQGRLTCGPLRSAHESVDSLFLETAVVFRDRRATLDSSAHARFSALADRADDVDRHFDGAGCRLPS